MFSKSFAIFALLTLTATPLAAQVTISPDGAVIGKMPEKQELLTQKVQPPAPQEGAVGQYQFKPETPTAITGLERLAKWSRTEDLKDELQLALEAERLQSWFNTKMKTSGNGDTWTTTRGEVMAHSYEKSADAMRKDLPDPLTCEKEEAKIAFYAKSQAQHALVKADKELTICLSHRLFIIEKQKEAHDARKKARWIRELMANTNIPLVADMLKQQIQWAEQNLVNGQD